MITIPISPGELFDRITILEIKQQNIRVAKKLRHIESELAQLNHIAHASIEGSARLEKLQRELKSINETLWEIEDAIRRCEKEADFGETFITLARSVYQHNDRRSDVKRQINTLLDSEIVEEKSYEDYTRSTDPGQ